MDAQKVDMYLMSNKKFLPSDKIAYVREKLLQASDEKFALVSSVDFKDPTVILIVSLLLGSLGIDRFMLGDTGKGILKLLTLGLFGIMTIVDWFTVQKKAREKNFNELMLIL